MLRISLMGPIDLYFGHRQLTKFPTRKSKALFAYLVLSRCRVLPREVLAAEFWGDLPEARARKALNTEFWRVGATLREAGLKSEEYLSSGSDGIGFRKGSAFWLDIAQFDIALSRIVDTPPEQAGEGLISEIKEAVALYRGDLLQGLFDDWCLIQREALRTRYLMALEYLLRSHMEHKAWEQALGISRILLGIDPLQEHIHRAVMRCHYLMGNRPAALKQYAACLQLLRQELCVEPMEETTRIYETILSVTPRAPEAALQRAERPVRSTPRLRKTPLEEVNLAIANIETARSWLIDAGKQMGSPEKPEK